LNILLDQKPPKIKVKAKVIKVIIIYITIPNDTCATGKKNKIVINNPLTIPIGKNVRSIIIKSLPPVEIYPKSPSLLAIFNNIYV